MNSKLKVCCFYTAQGIGTSMSSLDFTHGLRVTRGKSSMVKKKKNKEQQKVVGRTKKRRFPGTSAGNESRPLMRGLRPTSSSIHLGVRPRASIEAKMRITHMHNNNNNKTLIDTMREVQSLTVIFGSLGLVVHHHHHS